jgi:hypothetical protein
MRCEDSRDSGRQHFEGTIMFFQFVFGKLLSDAISGAHGYGLNIKATGTKRSNFTQDEGVGHRRVLAN